MPKTINVEFDEESKQKVEEMLRVAYRKVGYRNDGEIELNIRGIFLDERIMRQRDVVIGDEEFKSVLLFPIATDFGTTKRIVKTYNNEIYGVVSKEFDYSHRRTLFLMVIDGNEPIYVMNNYDYYYDWYFLESDHCENDVCEKADIEEIDFTTFKPRDYYVKAPKLSEKLVRELRSKLYAILPSLSERYQVDADACLNNCLCEIENGHLTSVLVNNEQYQHMCVLPLAYYFPRNDEEYAKKYGNTTRYGKTYAFEKWTDLALMVSDHSVQMTELTHVAFEELNETGVVDSTYESCDYRAKTLDNLDKLDINNYIIGSICAEPIGATKLLFEDEDLPQFLDLCGDELD